VVMARLRCYGCGRELPEDGFPIDTTLTKRGGRAYRCMGCLVAPDAHPYQRWAVDDEGVPYRLRG
jgi:hypothetical protein